MRVEKDFEEFLKSLNVHKVRYLIVGAYAVTFYSAPRNTGDLDIFIENSKTNAIKILKALENFGFESLGITTEELMRQDMIIQLGIEPNRIDLITSISGVNFQEAYKSKMKGSFGSQQVNFISFDKLVKNKSATGRVKDMADVELLLKFKNTNK